MKMTVFWDVAPFSLVEVIFILAAVRTLNLTKVSETYTWTLVIPSFVTVLTIVPSGLKRVINNSNIQNQQRAFQDMK
jgi:hypothetical protein